MCVNVLLKNEQKQHYSRICVFKAQPICISQSTPRTLNKNFVFEVQDLVFGWTQEYDFENVQSLSLHRRPSRVSQLAAAQGSFTVQRATLATPHRNIASYYTR